MDDLLNKPRVFISYSSDDTEFIDRLQKDLTRCQINSWRDQTDIRDGQPWMEAIFQHGIPTCDGILAYFTPSALKSRTMAREVDTAFLQILNDNTIGFLPYVSAESVRKLLRPDIQTLHCRVWHGGNYDAVLPTVVAEIWRSYLDRTVQSALKAEVLKRHQIELEVERLTSRLDRNIFTAKEEAEFEYLRSELERLVYSMVGKYLKGAFSRIKELDCRVEISSLRCLQELFLIESTRFMPAYNDRDETVKFPIVALDWKKKQHVIQINDFSWISDHLARYGLINRGVDNSPSATWPYTKKMQKFAYWLEYNEIKASEAKCQIQKWEEGGWHKLPPQ